MSLSLLLPAPASGSMEACGRRSTAPPWPGASDVAYLCILLMRVLSIWYGVQASIGGSCMLVMLRAMWPGVNNIRSFFPPGLELYGGADMALAC